ncbi:hypothetical protein I4U23_018953 [Adineta vaga]|nr:hypothetical protein I4U23_018953 [Adineta vaga]
MSQHYYVQLPPEKYYNSKTTTIKSTKYPAISTRSTVVKRPSIRSDTFLLAKKVNQTKPKVQKQYSVRTDIRRLPPIQIPIRSNSIPSRKKRVTAVQSTIAARPKPKYVSSFTYQRDPVQKPVYIPERRNSVHYVSTRPVYHRKLTPPAKDTSDVNRRIRIGKHDYIVQRRTEAADVLHNDRQTETIVEERRPKRVVRVLRESPRREDDVYYVKPVSPPLRRQTVIRKSTPPVEYIRVKKTPPPPPIRSRRSPRTETIYLDKDQSIPHNDDYIYIDEDGNEVKFIDEQSATPRYVEYTYEDDRDKRRERKVIYIDEIEKQPTPEPQIIVVEDREKRHVPESEVIYVKEAEPRRSHQPDVIYVEEKEERHSHQPEVIYVEQEQQEQHSYQPEVIYVEQEQQEQYVNEPNVIYVDDTYRSSHQPDVIYVEDHDDRDLYEPEVIYV